MEELSGVILDNGDRRSTDDRGGTDEEQKKDDIDDEHLKKKDDGEGVAEDARRLILCVSSLLHQLDTLLSPPSSSQPRPPISTIVKNQAFLFKIILERAQTAACDYWRRCAGGLMMRDAWQHLMSQLHEELAALLMITSHHRQRGSGAGTADPLIKSYRNDNLLCANKFTHLIQNKVCAAVFRIRIH